MLEDELSLGLSTFLGIGRYASRVRVVGIGRSAGLGREEVHTHTHAFTHSLFAVYRYPSREQCELGLSYTQLSLVLLSSTFPLPPFFLYLLQKYSPDIPFLTHVQQRTGHSSRQTSCPKIPTHPNKKGKVGVGDPVPRTYSSSNRSSAHPHRHNNSKKPIVPRR